MRNSEPARGPSLCASTVPPCSSTRRLTSASPMPSPPCERSTRALGLGEQVEDVRQQRRVDADAVVAMHDRHRRRARRRPAARSAPPGGGVLRRVVQQVGEHLHQALAVAATRRMRRRQVELELVCRRSSISGRACFDAAATTRAQCRRGWRSQLDLAARDARDVEQVVDQAGHVAHLARDDRRWPARTRLRRPARHAAGAARRC